MLHPSFMDLPAIRSLKGSTKLLKRAVKEVGLDSRLVVALNKLQTGDKALKVVESEEDLGNPIINPSRSLLLSGDLGEFCRNEGILLAILKAPGCLTSDADNEIERMYDACPIEDAVKYEIFAEYLDKEIFAPIENRILKVFT